MPNVNPTALAGGGSDGIDDVYDRADREHNQRRNHPGPVCFIDLHLVHVAHAVLRAVFALLRTPARGKDPSVHTIANAARRSACAMVAHRLASVSRGVPSQRKNSFGSTRCAASCGQAYTQLGSARSVHKSQEVAFCFTTAIWRPA